MTSLGFVVTVVVFRCWKSTRMNGTITATTDTVAVTVTTIDTPEPNWNDLSLYCMHHITYSSSTPRLNFPHRLSLFARVSTTHHHAYLSNACIMYPAPNTRGRAVAQIPSFLGRNHEQSTITNRL